MLNKKILFFAILIGVVFVFSAVQAVTTAVNGWAWSDNIGWIQMNPSHGGVFIDDTSGNFSGYAWSDNIGWIDFAPTSGFPSTPNNGVKLDWTSGQVSGWAKAVAGEAGGWDGWISMRGTSPNYGVGIDKTTGAFSGYAWGADVVGWVDFSKVTTSATTPPPEPTLFVTLTADHTSGTAPMTSILTAQVSGTATGPITYKFDCEGDGTYEKVFNNVAEETKSHSCIYNTAGSYTPKVYVERGVLNAEGDVIGILHDEATVAIAVGDPDGFPFVSITANPNPIDYNTSSTLTWSTVNTTSCDASGAWSGSKSLGGSESTGNLINDKTYTLTCVEPKGTASKSVTVQVNPAPILSCTLSATPSSGQSPLLDVILTASASGGSGTGYEYKFDYESDETYDTSYSASNTSTHTYTENSAAKANVKDSYGTTATCTTDITIIGDLSVSFTAKPSFNPSPLTTDLKAAVSGTAVGTINYTFWWNCDDTGTSVQEVTSICGDPTNFNNGVKYDNILDTSITERHTYSSQGDYTAKVIVERGGAPAAQNRTPINVGPPRPYFWLNNSNALHATIIESQPVTTASTTITVSAYNYFENNISLSVQSVEPFISGATFNFSDFTLSPSEYSVGSKFSVNLPGTAAPGTYTITITGDGGGLVSTVGVILNIKSVSTSEIWEF